MSAPGQDEDIRALERRVAAGEPDALVRFVAAADEAGFARDHLARRAFAALLASGLDLNGSLSALWKALREVDPALLGVEDPRESGGVFIAWGSGPRPGWMRGFPDTWSGDDDSGPVPEHARTWIAGNRDDRWCLDAYATEAQLAGEPAVRGFVLRDGEQEAAVGRAFDGLAAAVLPKGRLILYTHSPSEGHWLYRWTPFLGAHEGWMMFGRGGGGLTLGWPRPERRAAKVRGMIEEAARRGFEVELVEGPPPYEEGAGASANPSDSELREAERLAASGDRDAAFRLAELLDEAGDREPFAFESMVSDLARQATLSAAGLLVDLRSTPAGLERAQDEIERQAVTQVKRALEPDEPGLAWTMVVAGRDVYVVAVEAEGSLTLGIKAGWHLPEPDPGDAWPAYFHGTSPPWRMWPGVRAATSSDRSPEGWDWKCMTDTASARRWVILREAGALGGAGETERNPSDEAMRDLRRRAEAGEDEAAAELAAELRASGEWPRTPRGERARLVEAEASLAHARAAGTEVLVERAYASGDGHDPASVSVADAWGRPKKARVLWTKLGRWRHGRWYDVRWAATLVDPTLNRLALWHLGLPDDDFFWIDGSSHDLDAPPGAEIRTTLEPPTRANGGGA